MEVERILEGGGGIQHVAGRGVQDALGYPRRTGSVEHEQRVLRVHPLDLGILRGRLHDVVPPAVPALVEQGGDGLVVVGGGLVQPRQVADHNVSLDGVALLLARGHRGGRYLQQVDQLLAPPHPVGRDQDLGLGVQDSTGQGFGTVTT